VAQDFRRDYRSAKEFYDDEKFNFSMEAFRPLMVYDRDNPYVEYSTFYYALSAYHQNYFAVTKEALLQLKKLYPDWEHIDEANYWLAAVYFKQGEIFQALRMLYEMRTPRDLTSIERMKNYYLAQILDEEVVRLILEEFPGEITLLKRLITRSLAKGDYDKALQLIDQYGLNKDDFYFPKKARQEKKEKYRVAALFPFLTGILDPSPGNKFNQSALDLYQGMMLANDSLNKVGADIELVAYDTERKTEKVEQLMQLDEMKSVDVLVGPLFADELKPVAEFSRTNFVPVINTISNSAEFVKENPNALLLQPDYSVIGEASAESLSRRNLKRPCAVFYGDNAKDSIMAASFLKRAKELDLKIAFTKHIPHVSTPDVYVALVTPTKYDKFKNPIEFQLKRDSIGSVFVASDNELIFTKVISSVDRRGDSVIVVGMDSWLDKPGMEFEKFERLHIMMSSPDYTDIHSPEYLDFRRKYMAKYGIIPSTFAKNGFESMMLIGVSLKENGINFIPKLQDENSTTGVLKRFYNFHESQCNREVPFVIFSSGELRVLY
jgi:ABC-type branched-subunit amino acid transport system substrate-binding protein